MNRTLYAALNNILDMLPPFGLALRIRGRLAEFVLKKHGKFLKISKNVNIYNPSKVSVGDGVYIGFNTYLGGGEIYLDDEVIIGPFCSIVAGNHTMKDGSFRFGPYEFGTINIGRGTWLGSHVTITNNVKIGKGCLIGANSVVIQDVDDYSFVAGVPAKKIKDLRYN